MIRKKNKNIKLAEITSKYVGSDYTAYGKSAEEGFDCVSLMLSFLDEYGIKHPGEHKGWNLNNYIELMNKDINKAIEIWTEYLQEHTEEIDVKDMKAGDFILLKSIKTGEKFYCVFAGNNKIISVNPQYGVTIIPLRKVNILRVFKGVK